MIAAIFSDRATSSAAAVVTGRRPGTATAQTGWTYQRVPNLNRDTRQAIGKAKAGWTFTTICTELGYACHKGKSSWDQQSLGIGFRALAKESGQSLGKVRRDCEALEGLGLIVVMRPNVLHVADPATGKIVRKAKGRCGAAVVVLTILERHLRPAKAQGGTMGGTTPVPPPDACKVHGGTTVREESIQRTPDGDAAGSGSPPAVAGGRLTPAEAVDASPPILPLNAGRDEPVIPAGRILPAAPQARPRRRSEAEAARRNLDAPPPWDRDAQAAKERTLARLAAQEEARRRQDEEWRAERERREAEERLRQAEAPPAPPPPDRPAEAATEATAADPELRRLLDVIERKRAAGVAG